MIQVPIETDDTNVDKIIDVLIAHSYLKGKGFILGDLAPKGHGSCCYCGKCGRFHDECVCNHNELLEAIYKAVGRLTPP